MLSFNSETTGRLDPQSNTVIHRWANRLMRAGIAGYDRETRRRMAVINITGLLASLSCFTFASIFAVYNLAELKWVVIGNLMAALVYGTIFFWHRFGPSIAGVVLAINVYSTVFFFVSVLGRGSGIHLNFVGACAVAFLVFGLDRIRLILTMVGIGLALHVAAQMLFVHPQVVVEPWFERFLYFNSAATIVAIVGFIVWFALNIAAEAEERSERLLRNVLPESIADRLRDNPDSPIVDRFDEASVMFADIVGFTPLSNELSPEQMIILLNEIFSCFDQICAKHGTEKIKTIGDAYMVVAGVPNPIEDHANRIASVALEMQNAIAQISKRTDRSLELRIGIATGPITAGVIGKAKFSYDVWAPTVNLAARLESYGEPAKIHVSEATRRALHSDFAFEPSPVIEIKGIGRNRSWFLQTNLAVDDLND